MGFQRNLMKLGYILWKDVSSHGIHMKYVAHMEQTNVSPRYRFMCALEKGQGEQIWKREVKVEVLIDSVKLRLELRCNLYQFFFC